MPKLSKKSPRSKVQSQATLLRKLRKFCQYYRKDGKIYRAEFIVPDEVTHYMDGTERRTEIDLYNSRAFDVVFHVCEVPYKGY